MGIVLPASYSNGKQCTKANRVDNCKNSINLDMFLIINVRLPISSLRQTQNLTLIYLIQVSLKSQTVKHFFYISLFAVGIQK